MQDITIGMSQGNLRNAKKSNAFQVSASNLKGNEYTLGVDQSVYKKYKSAINRGKGLRIDACSYELYDDVVDAQGSGIKEFGRAITKSAKSVGRNVQKQGAKHINIMLDKHEKVANKKINSIQSAVEQELNALMKKTDNKTDQIIQHVGNRIDTKINKVGANLQAKSDSMQNTINKKLDKAFDMEVDQIMDEELDGGKIRWKKLGRKLKKAGRKVYNDAKKKAVDKITEEANTVKKAVKREGARQAIKYGAKAIGAVANYAVPGSGEVVEQGAVVGIKGAVKAINGSGIKGSCVKGSQEAKDKMARIRAMRGNKGSQRETSSLVQGSGFRVSGSGFMVS